MGGFVGRMEGPKIWRVKEGEGLLSRLDILLEGDDWEGKLLSERVFDEEALGEGVLDSERVGEAGADKEEGVREGASDPEEVGE